MAFPYLMMLHPRLIHGPVWPGKLGEGPIPVPSNSESNPTISENQPLYQQTTIQKLQQATPGNAGLDLRSTSTIILTSDSPVICLSVEVSGPPPEGTLGFILGQSFTSVQGINVVPGVIDPDFAGEIKIIVQPTTKTVQIHSGHCATQLLLLPYQISGSPAPQV